MVTLNKKILYTVLFICLSLLPIFSFELIAQNEKLHNLQQPFTVKTVDSKLYTQNDYRLTYDFNTINQENITVSWRNSYTKKTNNKWFVRLQYRLSEDSPWIDVKDKKGHNIEFVTTKKRYPRNFKNIVLPEQCNNKEFLQISWLIDTYNKDKSGYPNIVFSDLEISADYDAFHGKPAHINAYLSSDESKQELNSINFNKIPLPYVFPESKRITIESKNIRDSITLRIKGNDANYFSVSLSSIDAKYPYKTITVNYAPKKVGKHTAILTINTSKLNKPIEISLEGLAAKQVNYDDNLLPKTDTKDIQTNYFFYRIPVFSNTDYQYRLSQNRYDYQNIYICYKWYRDEELLFAMYDTVKKNEYCVPLQSPMKATALEIELKADNNIVLNSYYFGSPKVKTMVKSGYWSDIDNWQPKSLPNTEDFVVIDKCVKAKVDNDVACSMLILSDSANVSINTGKTFYISNNIFYHKNAWFSVHQYLLPSRWNYISSPINQAHAAIFSMKNNIKDNDTWFMQYNTGKLSKLDDYWSEYITDPKFTLIPGRGYAVYTHEPMDVQYEGLLCNSAVSITLVSSKQDRWNLIGNPYTAPLSSKKLFEDIDGKIQGNAIMLFDRESKVYNPIIIDPKEEVMIPSLESFFVEALEQPSEITFKRSQQYIPKTSEQAWSNNNYLNLSVSQNRHRQYVLLGMDNRSSYGFDDLDCHKMFGNNENMPDIYLKDDNDEYSVNVFPSYPAIYDIGLYIGKASEVEINLNNLSVMPDYVQIFIEDKKDKIFYDICKGDGISTYLDRGTTENYRIHILKSLNLNNTPNDISGIYLWKDNERMLLFCNGNNYVEKIMVKRNGNVILSDNININEVFQKNLNKGKYDISFLIKGKWSKEFKFEM